jgi:hypothetical protein
MSLLEELKRRNVVRTATFYLVAAWLILQVADLVFGALELPTSRLRLLFAGLLLRFPLALMPPDGKCGSSGHPRDFGIK